MNCCRDNFTHRIQISFYSELWKRWILFTQSQTPL